MMSSKRISSRRSALAVAVWSCWLSRRSKRTKTSLDLRATTFQQLPTNPYHPCMVYLPTFGWCLWYGKGISPTTTVGEIYWTNKNSWSAQENTHYFPYQLASRCLSTTRSTHPHFRRDVNHPVSVFGIFESVCLPKSLTPYMGIR